MVHMSTGGAGNLECNGSYHDVNEFHFVKQPSFWNPRTTPYPWSLLPPQIQHQKITTILLYTISSFTTSHLCHHGFANRFSGRNILLFLDGRGTDCITCKHMSLSLYSTAQHITSQRGSAQTFGFQFGFWDLHKIHSGLTLVMNNLA